MKIRPKTIDCIFICYAHNITAYRFLAHASNILDIHNDKNMIMESRNAYFFEDVFPCRSREEPSLSKRVLETITSNSEDQDKDGEVELYFFLFSFFIFGSIFFNVQESQRKFAFSYWCLRILLLLLPRV